MTPDHMFTEMRSDLRPRRRWAVRDNFIYIAAPRPVTVKVAPFSVSLSRRPHSRPESTELPMSAKGIYIIKIRLHPTCNYLMPKARLIINPISGTRNKSRT